MRSTFLSLLLFFSSASFSAASYLISSPGTGTVWNANDKVEVDWQGTDEPKVKVRLVYGSAANLQQYAVLCDGIDSSVGKCSYTVDSNIPSGRDYAVTVGEDPNNYGYSSFFTIKAKGDLPPATGCPNFGGQNCPESLPCCSASGYCGVGNDYCAPSNGNKCGNSVCDASNPCCSKYNFCGATPDHCGIGCQAGKSFNGKCLTPQASPKPKKCDAGQRAELDASPERVLVASVARKMDLIMRQ
ncbi:8583_t:CDS:2 [Paraglomus occultum]|uniref:8583_t:CDS:1 n=1 Tax=Paraglomus occultum TaxID=144539 RepID=A0A9N8W7H5_9GLOM|nr:8583_t:CDS:2 [Paraglomus occultum]